MTDPVYPLGRREKADPRDERYPLRHLINTPEAAQLLYRTWYAYSVKLRQTGDTCVANAWTHFITDSPRTHKLEQLDGMAIGSATLTNRVSVQSGERGFRGYLYDRAQVIDEWSSTPPEGGTSVRAGAKALQELGIVATYHWARTLEDVIDAVLTIGPVVVGTNWYESMFKPVGDPPLIVPAGGIAGGHAWVIDGVNRTTGLARMKNSWGEGWGRKGFAWIRFTDLERLLGESGEACIATEP